MCGPAGGRMIAVSSELHSARNRRHAERVFRGYWIDCEECTGVVFVTAEGGEFRLKAFANKSLK